MNKFSEWNNLTNNIAFSNKINGFGIGRCNWTNITGNIAFIEAWIRPYMFPATDSSIFPIITKIDSSTNKIHSKK